MIYSNLPRPTIEEFPEFFKKFSVFEFGRRFFINDNVYDEETVPDMNLIIGNSYRLALIGIR